MLRLAHRILSQRGRALPDDFYRAETFQEVATLHKYVCTQLARGVPSIIADNVAEYVNESLKYARSSIIDIRTYPPCPPAFDWCFIEWNEPPIGYPGGFTIEDRGCKQTGCFLFATENRTEIEDSLGRSFDDCDDLLKSTRWVLFGLLYACSLYGDAWPLAMISICLDPDGNFISNSSRTKVYLDDRQLRGHGYNLGSRWAEIMTTLGFLHCKNVQRIDVTKEEGPSPKWCRRQGVPELRYHVLQIDPNLGTKPRAGERKTEGDRSGKALHICRGHFAHFRDDGLSQGLFGRRQFGTFWIPAHTRGSLEYGRVISTYNVKTPA